MSSSQLPPVGVNKKITSVLVISYTPSRQGWLAPIPEKYNVETFRVATTIARFIEEVVTVPQGGWVKVVDEEDVVTIKARTVNEVVVQ